MPDDADAPTRATIHSERDGLAVRAHLKLFLDKVTPAADNAVCVEFATRRHRDAARPGRLLLALPRPEAERLFRQLRRYLGARKAQRDPT